MSHSHRHCPICGISKTASEKADKRLWNRQVRRINRLRLAQGRELLLLRETSNVYTGGKDGKQWFDARQYPRLMRK